MNKNKLDFLPTVFFRRYLLHIIIFLISLTVILFSFYFFAGDATLACAEISRCNSTSCKEVVYASSDPKSEEDSFYALNGKILLMSKNGRCACDIYMAKNNICYSDNAILFQGKLAEGECLISKNSASEYRLKIGDKITVYGQEIVYTVSGYLPPQAGLDSNYLYDGVILLSYNSQIASGDVNYANLSSELDTYYGMQSNVYMSNLNEKAESTLMGCLLLVLLFYIAVVFVCEVFLFSPRFSDYVLLNNEGLPRFKLLLRIFSDNLIKYTLPTLSATLLFMVKYSAYGKHYFLLPVILLMFSLSSNLVYSDILLRRLTKCYKIKA